jgi:hypothetical protein
MTTCRAPAARAPMTQHRPRWPAPKMTTRSLGPVAGIVLAQDRPAANGLNITATPAGICGFIFLRTVWGQRYMCSAYPPQTCGGLFTSVYP